MSVRRVLIIDDEPDMCDTLEMVIAPMGYEVLSVGSGEAAIAALAIGRFDLAITDYMMPGLDGEQTLEALKAADPALRVIVVTGYVSEDMYAACRARGALAILKKPFDVRELRKLIDEALAP